MTHSILSFFFFTILLFRSSIAREGTIRHSFEEKGQIKIGKKDGKGNEINFEKAEEIAIEAGAEEVREEDDDSWTFYTTPTELYNVKAFIEKELTEVEILSCELFYSPVVAVPLDDELAETVSNLVEMLSGLPEVNRVYDNAK